MSRNVKIEQILEVWFDADHCPEGERALFRQRRDEIIKKDMAGTTFTVEQVLDTLHGQYQDYRRDRKLRERLSGGQQASKK